MTEFRFQLLGPVRAWRDQTELELGPPQQQAVLAVLLLSRGGHVAMATMLDALWGECPPKSGAGAVRTYVSRLRQILNGGDPDADLSIEPIGDGYALCGGRVQVDIELFEERVGAALAARREGAAAAELCRAALRQWHGVPLVGVPGPYFEPVRSRMIEMCADAAEIEAAAQVEAGDHLAAIANLRALATANPLRENLHELLMLALYRAGRQADALEVYERARRILRDELGIEPGPSLKRMQSRVLSADDDLVPAAVALPVPVSMPAAGDARGAWDSRDERSSRLVAVSVRRGVPQRTEPPQLPELTQAEEFVDHVGAIGEAGRLGRLDRLEALSRQLLRSGGTDQRTVAARGRQPNGRARNAVAVVDGAASGGAPVGLLSIPRRAADSGSTAKPGPRPSSGLVPAQRSGGRHSSPLALRLHTARQRAFVGREHEIADFRSALDDTERPFTLLFVTGAGGIGKTSLLRRFAHEAAEAGRTVVELDGHSGECTPAAFEADARRALTAERAVLIVDGFEAYQPLETWLREDFLPRLSLGSIVVFAGRVRPARDWQTDPAWHEILRVLELGALCRADAARLLALRAAPPVQREALLSFAGGNPLALTLAADAAKREGTSVGDWSPTQELIGALVPQLIGDTPSPAYRQALDASALLQTANEELLRLVLQDPDIDVSAVFGWLRDLPFMESGPRGIRPHDVVRQVLDADLRWRDPERHQLLRNRIPARTPVPVPVSMSAPMLVVPVPIPVPDAAAAAVSREEFNAGVRSALRAWHHPDRLATGPLARTSLVRALDDAVAAEQIREIGRAHV